MLSRDRKYLIGFGMLSVFIIVMSLVNTFRSGNGEKHPVQLTEFVLEATAKPEACPNREAATLDTTSPDPYWLAEHVGGLAQDWDGPSYIPSDENQTTCLTVPHGAELWYITPGWYEVDTIGPGKTIRVWQARLLPRLESLPVTVDKEVSMEQVFTYPATLDTVSPDPTWLSEYVGGTSQDWFALNFLPQGDETTFLMVPNGASMEYKVAPNGEWKTAKTGDSVEVWHATLVPNFGQEINTVAWGPAGQAPQTREELERYLLDPDHRDWVGPLYHKNFPTFIIGWYSAYGLNYVNGNCVEFNPRFGIEVLQGELNVVLEQPTRKRVLITNDAKLRYDAYVYWTPCFKK